MDERMSRRAFLPALFLFLWSVTAADATDTVVVGGAGADLETFRILARAFQQEGPNGQIKVLPSIGSRGGVRGAATGRVDIGLVARPLTDKETSLGLTAIHYANTALVFATTPGHPVKDVDTEMLLAIYRGEKLGHKLKPILRPKTDSDTVLLQQIMPELSPAMALAYDRKGVPVGMTDQSTVDMLESTENTITTSTLALIMSERRPVQILSLNGVMPSRESIRDGSYPLVKKLFMVHDGALNDTERDFLEFVRSDRGRHILENTGHVAVRSQRS